MEVRQDSLPLLPKINWEIHDQWFDLDQVTYDPQERTWQLLFGATSSGPFDHILRITSVVSYSVRDEARIGLYDLDHIEVNLAKKQIVITSGFPLELTLDILPDFSILML